MPLRKKRTKYETKFCPSNRVEFCQIFRPFFAQWSFKKKCFWDLLTFNPQDSILYLVNNCLGWKGANIKTLWLHFSHFVCHRFSKDINSFFQSMVLHWITLFIPIKRSRIATLYENLKKKEITKMLIESNICPKQYFSEPKL